MNAIATIVAFQAALDALGSGSRAIFAMSRDGLFPKFLAKVHPKYDVPINALLLQSIPPMLIALIYIGNTTAFYGIMSGVLIIMMLFYCLPISMLLYRRLRGEMPFGPWSMGRVGPFINGLAICWTLFIFVVLSLPTQMPVTSANM